MMRDARSRYSAIFTRGGGRGFGAGATSRWGDAVGPGVRLRYPTAREFDERRPGARAPGAPVKYLDNTSALQYPSHAFGSTLAPPNPGAIALRDRRSPGGSFQSSPTRGAPRSTHRPAVFSARPRQARPTGRALGSTPHTGHAPASAEEEKP